MSIDQITSNGQKKYDYNGHKVESAYLQLYGMPTEAILNSWLTYLRDKVTNETRDTEMAVFIIFDLEANITYEYQITPNHTKKIVHKGILSRGKDVMPKIEKKYCASITSEEQVETIVKRFSESMDTIATMESCTGGALASAITNVSGASSILSESYVSYANEAKIKFGVPAEIIEAHTVYSHETAKAMANTVKKLANVTVGIGITGQIGRSDPNNPGIKANRAWYAIISSEKEISAEISFHVENAPRADKKAIITEEIINDLYLW
jgi:PncC family amidohydrolase